MASKHYFLYKKDMSRDEIYLTNTSMPLDKMQSYSSKNTIQVFSIVCLLSQPKFENKYFPSKFDFRIVDFRSDMRNGVPGDNSRKMERAELRYPPSPPQASIKPRVVVG